jgi:hypothetical protein
MRILIILCLFVATNESLAQRPGPESLLNDSLTSTIQKTWHTETGQRFTEINKDCNYGAELIFYKAGRKVDFYWCELGQWRKSQYTFEITTQNRRHYAELYGDNKELVNRIEIQIVKYDGNTKTELTLFDIGNKLFYTLISDGK